MNLRNFFLTAAVLIASIAAVTIGTQAQGPLYDRVMVNLPYTVTIGGHILQPGDYVIQQLRSEGGAGRVLLIYSNNGMKFETSAITIPALDNRTPEDTKVVLHHYGNDYYFDKVWIQGKNYGYEFPLPDSVKSRQRERMEPMNVAARYEATPETGTTDSTSASAATSTQGTTPATTTESTTVQSTTTQSTTQRSTTESATSAQSSTTPAPVTPSDTAVSASNQNQVTPPAASTDQTPATPAPQSDVTAANRTARTPAEKMPATAANWVLMLLSGGFLSGAGLTLRRFR